MDIARLGIWIDALVKEWETDRTGAYALCQAVEQETSPERQKMLLEAQLHLCCRSYEGMAEISRLGRQRQELWERPI